MNNSKILLSTIAISILCSVSLEANCRGINNGNSSNVKFEGSTKACTLSGKDIKTENYDLYHVDNSNRPITNKKITIKDSNITNGNSLYAATVNSGIVSSNKLEITDGSKVTSRYVGGVRVYQDGNAIANSLIISGAGTTLNRNGGLYHGAWVNSGGILSNNNVIVKDGATVTASDGFPILSGAYSSGGNGEALDNNIVIDSATVKGTVYGAFVEFNHSQSQNNSANKNTATIKGDANVTGSVYGAGGGTLVEANRNRVTIEGNAKVDGSVLAGEAGITRVNSKADGNSVTISDYANVTGSVTAGKISNSQATTADGNSVTIDGNAKVGSYVVAADVANGQTANKNSLTISGNANVTGNVAAAHVNNGNEANENSVTISGKANVGGNITGGGNIGGQTGTQIANNNKVTIEGNATVRGTITGGDSRKSEGQSNNNQITIGKDVNISGVTKIVGGTSKAGSALKNDINITNNIASTTTITGGEGNLSTDNNKISITGDINGTVIGGKSNRVTASQNNIVVTGKVDGNITGGEGNTSAGENKIFITGNISTGANGSGIIIGGKSLEGSATNNDINITGNVLVSTTITGGDAKTDADNNNISVSGHLNGTVIGGKSSGGAADNNTITVTSKKVGEKVKVEGTIIGGKSETGTATANIISVTGNVDGNITGGEGGSGAVNNTISIIGDIIAVTSKNDFIIGGKSKDGNATDNAIEIEGNVSAGTTITGGDAKTEANDNAINISGNVGGHVIGGRSLEGTATDNEIIVGRNVTGDVTGGIGKSNTDKNHIEIYGNVGGSVIGGKSQTSTAAFNNIYVDGNVTGNVTGGEGGTEADDNIIQVRGNVGGNVIGGKTDLNAVGEAKITAVRNLIDIGGNVEGNVTGGIGKSHADSNAIKISGNVGGDVIGGESLTGSATQNSIWILGNSGGHIVGGKTDSGLASNNTINIDGANTKGDIIGGLTTGNGQTDRNQITARGDINGSIYGGYKGEIGQGSVQGNNNTVTLLGNLTKVTGNIQVGSVDGIGNTLNINTNRPVTLEGNISGAQTISIAVRNIGAGDSAVIIGKDGFIDVKNATVTADLKLKPNVNVGDNIKLITAEDGDNSRIDGDLSKINVNVSSELFNMAISLNADGNLIVSDKKTNEKHKPISEGLISGAAAVFVASENTANKGVESAITSTSANMASAGAGASVIAPFASSTGGTSKIKTGSYVKTTGINMILGAANGRYTDNGKLTVGPFIEMGKNSYSTHNDFGDGKGEVRGDGDSKYIGAGLLARYDFGSTMASRPYIEGSARFGKNYNKYENTNITSNGKHAKYDMNTNYFGVHMGGGYEFRRDNQAVDLYAKYLYNNLAGDKIDIMDMPYDFKAVESHKLLTGARYKVDLDPINNFKLSPYAGAALDYEFKGSADVYSYGLAVDSPNLKGASAMLEAGLSIDTNRGFSVDVGAFGYVGKRQGINGLANIKFEF